MKITSLLSFCFVFLSINVVAVGDTIYFNNQWGKADKENASFFRLIEITSNTLHPYLVRDYYISGKLQMTGYYSSLDPEMKEGEFVYYHENGTISKMSRYENGKIDGCVSWYYEDGTLRETGCYKNGVATGKHETYFANGNLKSKGNYEKDRKEETWTYWFKNGQIKAQGNYKKDHKTGMWKYWHKNSQLKCIGKHKRGLASGKWVYWHDNGNKQSQGKFKSGQLTGKWRYYYESGNINMIGLYKKGQLTGKWSYFDEQGRMLVQQDMNKNNFIVTQKPELFDTTINIFAQWNIGDEKNIEIIQHVKTFSNDSVINEETTHYNVKIQIIEQTNDAYIAEWRYTDLYTKDELMISSLMKQHEIDIVGAIFKNLRFHCELEKNGSFRKLINIENIKKQLFTSADSIFNVQIENGAYNLYAYNYKELEQRFNTMKYNLFTDEFITDELTKEIQIFFNQNGKTFQTGQKVKMLSLVDLFGVKSPSKKFIEPVSIDKTNSLLSMKLKESISPMNQFPGNFKTDDTLSSFKIEETNSFTIDYNTGWIQSMFRENVLVVGEMKTIQTLEIR